ncbi:MAG TPA: hypothetical protein VFO65_02810 [Acidimicrobiales bacterium]|nr:hypothetical protein [Acidimicrobiales bacterium]
MLDTVRLQVLKGPVFADPLRRELLDALVEVQATESAGQRGGFQMKFRLDKGGPVERELHDGGFEPPTRVQLLAVVSGRVQVLMDGVIARNDVAVSSTPGASTLSVTGSDVSQMMDLLDLTGIPLPMPAEAQVPLLLSKYAMYGVVPMVIPSPLLFTPNPIERFPTQQGTDYAHITTMAGATGYVFYVEPGPAPGMNVAYWGPEIRVGEPQAALTVNSDSASTVDSLSVSFDGIRKTQYVGWIHPRESRIPIPIPVPDVVLSPPLGPRYIPPRGIKQINRAQAPRQEDATARRSPVEAVMLALARAAQGANVVTASGQLDVVRYGGLLKARRLVGVRGAGALYDGHWFVRSVSTTLARGRITQSFSLDRNAFESWSDTLPVTA